MRSSDEVLLSASMIVRDEARHLAACLASVRDVVDEMVVVDTGSKDDTVAIAESFGAQVFQFPWVDDFAAARNFALDRSRGSWILYIDADERLRPADRAYVEEVLSDPRIVGYQLRFYPLTGHTGFWEHRLFRNDPRIRFEGAIHERITLALQRVARSDGLGIARADLTLDHFGYDGDQSRKHLRNLPLLRKQIERDPRRIFLWDHLATVLAALEDDAGAVEAWSNAIAIARTGGGPPGERALPYAGLIRWQHARGRDIDDLLHEARVLFPQDHTLAWIEGRRLMERHRYEEAIAIFERLAAIDAEQLVDPVAAYDKRIFGALSYASLGAAFFRLGRYQESARWFRRAEEAEPEDRQHAIRRRLAEIKAGGIPAP
jgi:glycosyltransferase involved in cell wall biosynthesis